MGEKKYLETPIRDERLLEEARQFLNEFCGLKKHKFTKNDITRMGKFKLSLKLDAMFWNILRPYDNSEIDYFYRITPFEFVKNLVKSMDGMHRIIIRDIVRTLEETKSKTVLDFGGGSGFISLVLCKFGYKVTFAEINTLSLKWMEHIKDRWGSDIKIVDLNKEQVGKKYDLIILKDVLEHCKNYRSIIRDMRKKSKNLIVTENDCKGPEDWLPMHFKTQMDVK